MDNQDIDRLIEKYLQGRASVTESDLIEKWYFHFSSKQETSVLELDFDKAKKRLWNRIYKKSGVNLIGYISAAAVISLIGTFVYFMRFAEAPKNTIDSAFVKADIRPGKKGATLTLANGKKISLGEAANGKISNDAGVNISKFSDGKLVYTLNGESDDPHKINILATANGETYEVHLPDGSLVSLNAASTLEYPANFSSFKERRVKLTGEGYFEVAKDSKHPFIVETNKQQVEVLGTHFNINSYLDEPQTRTTLLEGSVKVISGGIKQILKPGEQAINNGGSIQVEKADAESIMDWKAGEFYLNHVDLKTALRKVSRWYDVEIIYDASVPDDIITGGWISKENKLSTVLKLIEKSGLAKFKLQGRKVYVFR